MTDTTMKNKFITFYYACYYSVDVLWYISGFYIAYICCEQTRIKKFGFSNILESLRFFAHKLFKIWPVYIFVILFFMGLANYVGHGPAWFHFFTPTSTCLNDPHGGWWKNMLFIDVYGKTPNLCV